jgi:hypothetical protein
LALDLPLFGLIGQALVGIVVVGIAQGWVLGRSKIWCWILANLVGIAGFLFVGYFGIFFVAWLMPALSFIPVLSDSFERLGFMGRAMFFLIPTAILGSATFGAITGNALIRLLKE